MYKQYFSKFGKKGSKKIIIIPLISIIIIFLAFTYFNSDMFDMGKYSQVKLSKSEKSKLNRALEACKKIDNVNESKKCEMISEISITENPSVCRDYSGENKEWCYAYVAFTHKDMSICKELGGKTAEACMSILAVEKNKPEICRKLSTKAKISDIFGGGIKWLREECYKSIAKNRKDISLCDKLKEDEERRSKYTNSTYIAHPKDQCIIGVAKAKGNIKYCYKINETLRNTCLESVATKTNNASICKRIKTGEPSFLSDPKFDCVENIVGKTGNYDVCKDVNEQDRWGCYKAAMNASTDLGVCKYFEESERLKRKCYERIARNKANPNVCNIIDEGSRSYIDCLLSSKIERAASEKDSSICNFQNYQIKENFKRGLENICLLHYALKGDKYSLCGNISFNLTKNETYYYPLVTDLSKCYFNWARKEGNISICKNGTRALKDLNQDKYVNLFTNGCYHEAARGISNYTSISKYFENI